MPTCVLDFDEYTILDNDKVTLEQNALHEYCRFCPSIYVKNISNPSCCTI